MKAGRESSANRVRQTFAFVEKTANINAVMNKIFYYAAKWRRRAAPTLPLAVMMTFALAIAPTSLPAQPTPHPVLSNFQLTGDYVLMVAGEERPNASIYFSQRAAALLVLDPSYSSATLVWARTGRVDNVSLLEIRESEKNRIDLYDGVQRIYAGDVELLDGELVFTLEGQEARLKPKPPLLGVHKGEDLIAQRPDYARRASSYQPDPASIERLRQRSEAVRVRVFFGSWCSACKVQVPHILKVEQELDGSQVQFEYFGIPNPPEGWQDPEVKRNRVKAVPTGIIYVAGQEAGRLSGTDWDRPERSLISLLN